MLSLDFFLIPCYNIFIKGKRKNVPSPGSEATRARDAQRLGSATCNFVEGERSEPSSSEVASSLKQTRKENQFYENY